MTWLQQLLNESSSLLAWLLVVLASALVLLWLRHAVRKNERLELNILGKHLIVVQRIERAGRRTRQVKDPTRQDEE